MDLYVVIDKYYSKEDGLFHIVKGRKYTFERKEETFDSFDDFYIASNKNLSGANLLDYDFEGVDIKKYELSKAKISSNTMKQLGTYNDKLFRQIINDRQLYNLIPSQSLDLVPHRSLEKMMSDDDDLVVCYLSDLHLNHKLIRKFQDSLNKFELDAYLRNIVIELKNSIPNFSYNCKILFVGDISFNFEIFKQFFNIYSEEIYQTTFVILGNHELWDSKLNRSCKSIEEIVEKYRDFLSSLDIHLLENQLYLPHSENSIYSEEELLTLDNKTLREMFLHNGYAIFGGIGYAGQNEEFNCNQGIYRTQYITQQQEIERSNKVDALHKKLSKVAFDKKIFFATHMPKEDWSTSDYNKNWIYISGHNHKNYYAESEEKKIYADNQIGYENSSFEFKFLTTSSAYDIFQDYSDGIYELTRSQYILFYYGIGTRIDFKRDFEKLYMLKRCGTYCFLLKPHNSNELKLLNGGSIKNVGKHDINYFYKNLVNYSNSVKLFLASYENFQKQVSNEIKRIGGGGHIHGSIIDIDYYNHLYINPLDGTITPYNALNMSYKFVYPNLISLLKKNNPLIYENYKKQIGYENAANTLMVLNKDTEEIDESVFVPETEMYRISRILRGFQYTTKYNVVRLWNDTIASNRSAESGKLIISGIINLNEMKAIRSQQKQLDRAERLKLKAEQKQNSKPLLTAEERKKILFDKHADKIKQLSNGVVQVLSYNGAKEKAEYECLHCGAKWTQRADKFIERHKGKCPKCQS